MKSSGYVYLLHFHTPLAGGAKSSSHYVGWSRHYAYRIAQHRAGAGARILQVCADRGIAFDVAIVISELEHAGVTYRGTALERYIKRQHHHARYCPLCGGRGATDYRDAGQCAPATKGRSND